MSRIKDRQTREDLEIAGEGWGNTQLFFDEKRAQQEFSWLVSHPNYVREYVLASRLDNLDDEIPWR